MAEYVANAVQEVADNGNVLFTDDIIGCNNGCIVHRAGSGLFTLRGIVNNPTSAFSRYQVIFGSNIAVPSTGTAGAISVSLAIQGEAVPTSSAIVTPAAVSEYWNATCIAYVTVPRGCCYTVAVENTSGQAIDVQNANIVINRVA